MIVLVLASLFGFFLFLLLLKPFVPLKSTVMQQESSDVHIGHLASSIGFGDMDESSGLNVSYQNAESSDPSEINE